MGRVNGGSGILLVRYRCCSDDIIAYHDVNEDGVIQIRELDASIAQWNVARWFAAKSVELA